MGPWTNAANAYQQGLNGLQQTVQHGYDQMAQMPLTIYDRFIQGYTQARQQKMQEQQFGLDSAYKGAQISHLNAQNQELESKVKKEQRMAAGAQAASMWYQKSLKPDGSFDTGKFNLGMASDGFGEFAADATHKILQTQKDAADITSKRLEDRKKASEQAAQLAYGGLAPGGSTTETLKSIRGLRDGNPELFGHITIPDGIDMAPPEVQKAWLANVVRAATPVEKQLPKTEIKETGGYTTAYNIDPLTGSVAGKNQLGYNPQSNVGKAQLDINAGAITPEQGNALIRKETTVQPTMGTVMLKQMEGAGNKEGSEPLDPGEEVQAEQIARGKRNLIELNSRNAAMGKRINARGLFLSNQYGTKVAAPADISEQTAGQKAFSPEGTQGKNLIALDTATKHLSQLGGAISALGNNDVTSLNKFRNWYRTELGGSADVTNFDTVKSVAIPEVLKVAKGAGVINESEEKRLNDIAKSSSNPAALRGFVNEYKKIMKGRAEALQPQYERYFPGGSVLDRVTPESAAVYRELGFGKKPDAEVLLDKAKGPAERKQFKNNATGAMEWFKRDENGKWVKE